MIKNSQPKKINPNSDLIEVINNKEGTPARELNNIFFCLFFERVISPANRTDKKNNYFSSPKNQRFKNIELQAMFSKNMLRTY